MAVFKVTREQAAKIRDNYFARPSQDSGEPSEYAQRLAKKHKKVKIWTGRYRHFNFPGQQHKAFNAIVQGGAAEFVEDRMLALDDQGCNNDD